MIAPDQEPAFHHHPNYLNRHLQPPVGGDGAAVPPPTPIGLMLGVAPLLEIGARSLFAHRTAEEDPEPLPGSAFGSSRRLARPAELFSAASAMSCSLPCTTRRSLHSHRPISAAWHNSSSQFLGKTAQFRSMRTAGTKSSPQSASVHLLALPLRAPAAAKGGLPAKLTPKQVCTARKMLADPEMTIKEVAEAFGVNRETIYRSLGLGSCAKNGAAPG
jgi:Helix-turn-helix domain of resolvase